MPPKTTLADLFADTQIHYVPVGELVPAADNPRVRLQDTDPDAFDGLRRSLRRGIFKPIYVEQPTKEIIDGHQSLDAAIAEGSTHVPVLYLKKLTRNQKIMVRIEINRHRGKDDVPLLRQQIASLPEDDMKAVMEHASLSYLLEPAPEAKEEKPPSPFTTFKVNRMPTDAAQRAHEILASFCERHQSKEAAALLFILEQYAQNPDLAETA